MPITAADIIGLGAGGTLGLGTGALARILLDKQPDIPSVAHVAQFPLHQQLGAKKRPSDVKAVKKLEGKPKTKGEKAKEKKEKKAGVATISPKVRGIGEALLAGSLGGLAGYKGIDYLIAKKREEELKNLLSDREALFNQLLLEEQANAIKSASEKSASALDAALDIMIPVLSESIGEAHKSQMQKQAIFGLGPNIGQVSKKMDIGSYKTLLAALLLGGGALGAAKGFTTASSLDPNRVDYKDLKNALSNRLRGDDKGPGAPRVVRLHPSGLSIGNIGAQSALIDPNSGRDILGDL